MSTSRPSVSLTNTLYVNLLLWIQHIKMYNENNCGNYILYQHSNTILILQYVLEKN